MKLVKDLQKWIDGYNEVKTLADELELAFDFYKEELVTEEDVDTAYAKAREAVEALELKNMLRDEADQMDCVLKINSGAGGTESQDWASMLMRICVMLRQMAIRLLLLIFRKVMRPESKPVRSILKGILPTVI